MTLNPAHLSITQLSQVTGMATNTIKKRLIGLVPVEKRGMAIIYNGPDALKMIYTDAGPSKNQINIDDEKARTEFNRADKLEMENAVRRGELVERKDVLIHIQKSFAAVRAKLLAIPTKAAPVVITLGEVNLAQTTLKKFVYDALDELTEYNNDEGVE